MKIILEISNRKNLENLPVTHFPIPCGSKKKSKGYLENTAYQSYRTEPTWYLENL